MTQEEKARAYDEALERAKKYNVDDAYAYQGTIVKLIFPELAKSKGERHRKWILEYLYDGLRKADDQFKEQFKSAIAWLEKQKELTTEDIYNAAHECIYGEEKQKEQKEQKEIPLMDGDADLYFDNWIQHNNATKRECFEAGITYLYRLLNEQKEQKPILSDRDLTDFEIEVHEIIAQARNDSRLNDAGVLKQFEEEAAFALMLKANKLIEQKPAESISQLTVQGKGVYKICPRCKERMIRDDSMVYTSMPPQYIYECPKCGERECDTVMYDSPVDEKQKEQKPVEFTHHEVDESLVEAVDHQMEDDGDVDDFVRRGIDDIALKYAELGAKWQKEQKPEWNEEDERILNQLISDVEYHKKEGLISAKQNKATKALYNGIEKCYDEKIAWLKSLKPSWRPSAQELGALKTAVSVLTEERTFPKAAEQIQKIIDVFDGKELRKDWKPSEVQMKALKAAMETYDGFEEYDTMKSLYEDLKKLM